jgi:hypothetical protein
VYRVVCFSYDDTNSEKGKTNVPLFFEMKFCLGYITLSPAFSKKKGKKKTQEKTHKHQIPGLFEQQQHVK